MPPIRIFSSMLALPLIILLALHCKSFTPLKAAADNETRMINDSFQIIISAHIQKKYPCLFHLMQEIIAKNDSANLIDGLTIFKQSTYTRLYILDKVLDSTIGAQTQPGPTIYTDKNGDFIDTIFLNNILFKTASKDYLVSVFVHECWHVYFNWCYYCFKKNLQPVDTAYLKAHFQERWDWLSSGEIFFNDKDHQLMSEHFLLNMKRFIRLFTNQKARKSLQDSIALSFAWGGLHDTPGFRKQTLDTCYMQSVDGWARNMAESAPPGQFNEGNCHTKKSFLDSLYLLSCGK